MEIIKNENEYFAVLSRMLKGSQWIENERAKSSPSEKLEAAQREYDRLEHMVLVYKGLI